jgi:hypothetical protein
MDPKVPYRVHKTQQVDPILSHMQPLYTFLLYFPKI